ncbi:probable proton-coupled zinc antiporter SLC30A3 isoform X1 [Balaenoptera acutorostrata]|uniref:Probable proton-coupled zinc antiporter SLC30A3 n=2 Tax=Balaenoptera acutorostrata TaxID=9767 RepID=A0A384AW94_BALAC|nr:probable proton-coupled zinc antiporter SLC30A3 isoform X1 [Balaenoptera acutorostrata]
MEPSPATGGSETTRLVSPRDRGGAGGGLRLKSLFTEASEPLPEEPKPVEMSFHHCHRDPLLQPGLTPERLQAQRQLCAACAVCCVFMAGEVVGGYLAHSLAIMTDAAHLLADVGSMMGSLFSLWLSTRPATRTMTFGWHRSETLGALASVVSLWMVTGILLYLAFIRLLHSDYHIEGGAMLLTASIAVCANLLMAFVLHQAGPHHSHGSRGAEYAPLEEGPGEPLPLGNTSVRAAFVHVLGDLLQSLGVLAASILIYFKPQYKAADPISTFLFSICALGSTAPTLRDVLRVLMEGTPRNVGFEPVRDTLLSVPGVRATHELHLWSLTLTYHVVSAHLAIAIICFWCNNILPGFPNGGMAATPSSSGTRSRPRTITSKVPHSLQDIVTELHTPTDATLATSNSTLPT